MSRNALRVFFERVIVASLPLAISACGGGNPGPTMSNGNPADMAMVIEAGGDDADGADFYEPGGGR